MNKDLELWQFISERIGSSEPVMLLVVAESSGSSPGRPGYKMAVGADGKLIGSIGGGVMEVNLVEQSRRILAQPETDACKNFPNDETFGEQDNSSGVYAVSGKIGFGTNIENPSEAVPPPREGRFYARLIQQVHQKDSSDASGMICSGRQTVIMGLILPKTNLGCVERIVGALRNGDPGRLRVSSHYFRLSPFEDKLKMPRVRFHEAARSFMYEERFGLENELYIIGGGHCSLALSALMSKLDFRITIFDDRPDLNTIDKNRYAHEIRIIDNYENIGDLVTEGPDVYVVIMTIGYASDEVAIRSLIKKEIKYLGVLGSRAKMKVLLKSLEKEGIDAHLLSRIHTPIGLPINSRSPEEIAVSIAAEIISVKNA